MVLIEVLSFDQTMKIIKTLDANFEKAKLLNYVDKNQVLEISGHYFKPIKLFQIALDNNQIVHISLIEI